MVSLALISHEKYKIITDEEEKYRRLKEDIKILKKVKELKVIMKMRQNKKNV